jgi:hypothetical protein
MFVLLFAYVFGGAIPLRGAVVQGVPDAGIFAQTLAFAAGTPRWVSPTT